MGMERPRSPDGMGFTDGLDLVGLLEGAVGLGGGLGGVTVSVTVSVAGGAITVRVAAGAADAAVIGWEETLLPPFQTMAPRANKPRRAPGTNNHEAGLDALTATGGAVGG